MDINRVRKIYDAMSAKYNMADDFDTFAQGMNSPEKVKKVYDAMSAKYTMQQDFDTFYNMLGVTTEQPKEEKQGFLQRLGSMPHATATGAVINPSATAEAPVELTDDQKQAQAEMRQYLQETGVIDSMEKHVRLREELLCVPSVLTHCLLRVSSMMR